MLGIEMFVNCVDLHPGLSVQDRQTIELRAESIIATALLDICEEAFIQNVSVLSSAVYSAPLTWPITLHIQALGLDPKCALPFLESRVEEGISCALLELFDSLEVGYLALETSTMPAPAYA